MYADVLLPLPITGSFTYSIPDEMRDEIRPGSRVVVPFGAKKFYTAIVRRIHGDAPKDYEVKEISLLLDSGREIVRPLQLQLWDWLAEYYLCSPGDIYRAGVPAGLKVESETFVELNPDYMESPDEPLSEHEALIVQVLDHAGKRQSIGDIQKSAGLKRVPQTVARLMEKGAVIISERLVERYRVKHETYVRPACPQGDMTRLRELFAAVSGAPKQEKALQMLIELSGLTRRGEEMAEIPRSTLAEKAGVSLPIINALEKKGVVEIYRKEINRFKWSGRTESTLPHLSTAQGQAAAEIHTLWHDKNVVLLHGVTSSGKTEVYMHLIAKALEVGKQALLLVPEIALTTQLAHRLQQYFGEKVVVYHSKFSDNERVDIWRMMLSDPSPRVILGARSSVFLPYHRLGLVIVDEEHEGSFKQSEPAPRYNARDAAIVLAGMHGAKVLLGSATPSVETYYKATEGAKYGLVTLTERYGGATLPAIEIVDMAVERKRGQSSGSLSLRTEALVRASLAAKRQSILFIPRRGFAPAAICGMCAYIPKCRCCDVSLTYHRSRGLLVCHYCGATQPLPKVCPACKEPAIRLAGYGSERVEDEIGAKFPDARISRMDLDTTRAKDSYENLIDEFSSGRTDILVGTQMVTKGLDFKNVDTVGVINADSVINYPDYHSTERAFNMISQVAGRAGRTSGAPGIVAVQTSNPSLPIFDFIRSHDYPGFYHAEIEERRRLNYPPFSRIINLYIRHRDPKAADLLAEAYAMKLRELFGTRVNGPVEPPVGRVQSLYIRKIMLKIETAASMPKVRAILLQLRNDMHALYPDMKRALIHYDADPC